MAAAVDEQGNPVEPRTTTRVRDTRGREERRRSHTARVRRANLAKHYRHKLSSITPGDFDWSLTLIRGSQPPVELRKIVESFEWADEASVLTGAINLRRPDPDRPTSVPLVNGDRIRCRVWWGGKWYELWTMRCSPPSVSVEEGTVTVELNDDLAILKRSKREWVYRKTKRRKRGYFAHEIARLGAKRAGVKLGQIARGTVRIDKVHIKNGSYLDLLKKAYGEERQKTGRRFVIRMRNGKVEVVPYRRNAVLYVIQHQLLSVQTTYTQSANPVTVIEGKATIGKGKGAKKIRHTEYRRDLVRKFGYSHVEKSFGRVKSRAELRDKCRRELAKGVRVKPEASLSFPGIPFIRRGDGMQWVTDEPYWHGRSEKSLDRSYVFAKTVRHRVSPGDYVTECELSQDDPFTKDAERMDKEARERARRERKKRRRR